MNVCRVQNCNDRAQPGDVYCARCREELDAMATRHPKPINWWAVFLIGAALTAYAVLIWTGRV